jgi:hypothetical protein
VPVMREELNADGAIDYKTEDSPPDLARRARTESTFFSTTSAASCCSR